MAEKMHFMDLHLPQLIKLTEVRSFARILVKKNIITEEQFKVFFSGMDDRENNKQFFQECKQMDDIVFEYLVEWLRTINHDCLNLLKSPVLRYTPCSDDREVGCEELNTGSNEHPMFSIQVECADEFFDTRMHNKNMEFYSCRSKKRGEVLIINNIEFEEDEFREGAKVCEQNLKELFQQMGGWKIQIENNLTAAKMKQTLQSFSSAKRENLSDICFLIIMSHGSEKNNDTIIFGTDSAYLSASEIQDYFNNERCPSFRGKPKVILYQVCRGQDIKVAKKTTTQYDIKRKSCELTCNNDNKKIQQQYFRPLDDMLVGYATMRGSKAHRDTYQGAWYIRLICERFMKLAKEEPVDNLLMLVDNDLRNKISENCTVQTAEYIINGFKKLYLNPGIYEENGELRRFHKKEE